MLIAKEGVPFIFAPILVGAILFYLGKGWIFPAIVCILLGLFCAFFFRDPMRAIPTGDSLIVSPADGTIMEVTEQNGEKIIRIFLSVFNVHLQRAPVAGVIQSVTYRPGKFLPAMDKNAHLVNEQNVMVLTNAHGSFVVKQIAGILARRVVSWVHADDHVQKGQKIGLIKFGSQVDIHMPPSAFIKVKLGDTVVGGETIIGEMK